MGRTEMAVSEKDCLFCKIVRKEIKADIVKEGNSFIAIKDINPVEPGHVLVIPKQHYTTLLDIPDRLGEEMLKFAKQIASELLEKKLGDGFNIIMNNLEPAGQLVMHAHIHIIPRKEKDGIRFFVKVLGKK
ncbi:MAG: HIT domain-containing protein [archaeon]|nr:HIT domain-containing protein [archaeon]